jgi:hypothetical protein
VAGSASTGGTLGGSVAILGLIVASCYADLTNLAGLLASYGQTSGMGFGDGDFDLDGDVDLPDLAELLAVYGMGCD